MIHKLYTIKEHDALMEEIVASGAAEPEPEPSKGKVIFSKIKCPNCSWQMFDRAETKTDPDNKKYRKCYCFKCGNTAWRRTL